MSTAADGLERPSSPRAVFVAFTVLAMQGFGGVLPVAQRELVERRRWLSREQFLETLALGQVLPGPNIVNMGLIIGDRFFGWRGALAAVAGLLALPMTIVLLLAALYAQFAQIPAVAGALRGMGAVAAGLILATALKLVPALAKNPMGRTWCAVYGALTLIGIAVLRWPMVWVVLGLGTLAWLTAWRRIGP